MILLVSSVWGWIRDEMPNLEYFGHLHTPAVGAPVKQPDPCRRWAADNSAFSNWDESAFRRMLNIISEYGPGLWVAAPDTVGDAKATTKAYLEWRDVISPLPIAYVLQDGCTSDMVPWNELAAVFVGGTTEWKYSFPLIELIREAKDKGLWVHMGRVNSIRRIRWAHSLGCDSFDGTQFSWFKDTYIPSTLALLKSLDEKKQLNLFGGKE